METEWSAFCGEYTMVAREYSEAVHRDLAVRWEAWTLDLSRVEVHEVIGGLLARQVTLATQMAASPALWTGHLGPLILRAMCDAHINLAWILGAPDERARLFVRHALGQEKLYVEHLKNDLPADHPAIQARETWINAQRFTFLTEVNVGDWANIDTRKRAIQSGCEDLYRLAYQPWSMAAHSMWSHIERYNLYTCDNALHGYHRIPCDPEPPFDPSYLDNAAKYLDRSFATFDQKLRLAVEPSAAHMDLGNAMAALQIRLRDASEAPVVDEV